MTTGSERPRLVFATGNPHKVAEVQAILTGWQVEALAPDVDETGTTFAANARLKAEAVHRRTGLTAVGEDSGIVIDALDGRPGVHSARWTDEADWIPRVLRELAAVPDRPRTARYVAALCVLGDGIDLSAEGTVEGTIAFAPRGDGGFGYDPIFVPSEADGRTFGELPPELKHRLSHRGRAFRAVAAALGDDAPRADVSDSR